MFNMTCSMYFFWVCIDCLSKCHHSQQSICKGKGRECFHAIHVLQALLHCIRFCLNAIPRSLCCGLSRKESHTYSKVQFSHCLLEIQKRSVPFITLWLAYFFLSFQSTVSYPGWLRSSSHTVISGLQCQTGYAGMRAGWMILSLKLRLNS